MPKYSFIVPVYNCGRYLVPCVESLLAQTVRDFEILLIDDGTPDDGGAVCDGYANRYECIRAFHKENGGAASARNYGIDRAEGEYLLFIDGDDTIVPDTLSRIDNALSENPADLVIFGMSFDYYEKRDVPVRSDYLSCKHHGFQTKGFYAEHFQAIFDDNALSSACNKVFSSRLIKENHLFFRENMTIYEDLEFVLRYFACAGNFLALAVPLYHYRIPLATMATKRIGNLPRVQGNFDVLIDTVLMIGVPQAVSVVGNLYLQVMERYLFNSLTWFRNFNEIGSYCANPRFYTLLEKGCTLGRNERNLLDTVSRGNKVSLLLRCAYKKKLGKIRRVIKRLLRCMKRIR